MTDERPQRISIGFIGGQALAARVKSDQLAQLRQALGLGSAGWHELEAEDGLITLDLTKIVYVQVDDDEHRVGFGA